MITWLLIGIATTLTPDFIANVFGQIYRAPAAGFPAREVRWRCHGRQYTQRRRVG